jgi:predicted dehydrogenase
VGPLTDVGVYPISILTALLGPVDRVSSFGKTVLQRREKTNGEHFSVLSPDVIVAGLEFDNGVLARVTASFYVGPTTQQGIEIHGDEGSLHLVSSVDFASPVMLRPFGRPDAEWTPVPHVRQPHVGAEWGTGIFELVEAIEEGRPNRGEGHHGLHVVDICCSATESAQSGRPVRVMSTFAQPSPMPWAL